MLIKIFQVALLVLYASAASAYWQAPVAGTDKWVDLAAGDYDVQPDITYAVANNTELKLDLYLPKNRREANPLLVFFHGGGWVDGAKERSGLFLLPYLALGWSVINVEYRLVSPLFDYQGLIVGAAPGQAGVTTSARDRYGRQTAAGTLTRG